ncbi:MAG: transcriptional regulator [Natronospirillum sp.]|uniref:HlyU family transcriptional regulator n=1 Tax=Natronospirillum sp. TaxID=2812955 RepID=UPI0025DE9BD3|nr:HlyU family transcriptional regulator [Natronospirillum sp.]MCH8550567.1 transcriptional regulator [Natronospirillum sp.]
MLQWLKSLVSGSSDAKGPKSAVQHEEEYRGYHLAISPIKVGGQYRIAGTITRLDNPEQRYNLIRADLCPTLDIAVDQTLTKARQTVDQLGDRMFAQSP